MLPFSTAFYSKNFNYNGPFIFYCFNLVMIGLFNYLMVRNIIRKEGHSEALTPLVESWLKFRAMMAPLIWLLSIVIAFIEPTLARFTFVLISIFLMIGERRFKKKLKQQR